MYSVPFESVMLPASTELASSSDVPLRTTAARSCGAPEDASVYVDSPSNVQLAVLPVVSIDPLELIVTSPAVYTAGLFVFMSRSPSVIVSVPLTSSVPDMMISSSPEAPVLFSIRL